MKIDIRNRFTREVIYSGDHDSIKTAMAAALGIKINLSDADLSYANLSYADLSDANLSYANLSDADLSYADLSDANLRDANLSYADLSDANLSYANLSDADLSDANLRDADLSYADLSDANLRDANLSYADLSDANLSYANLSDANLSYAKADFLAEVLKLPNELEFLRAALIEGKVDGSTYSGECACLAGTLAHACGIDDYRGGKIENGCTFIADSNSPRERFFLAIKRGDTPETNPASKIALDWTDEAIAIRDNIRNTNPKGDTKEKL